MIRDNNITVIRFLGGRIGFGFIRIVYAFSRVFFSLMSGMMREKSIYFNVSAGGGLRIPWVILLAYSVEIGLSRQHPKASRTKRIIYLLFVLSSFRLKRARPYQR